MLTSHATQSPSSSQDTCHGGFPGRRPEADRARLGYLLDVLSGSVRKSSGLKPNEIRVYTYVVHECYALPIFLGESDRVMPMDDSPSAMGRSLGIDPGDASRAIDGLIAKGLIKAGGGRLWPCRAGFVRMAGSVEPPPKPPLRPFRESAENPQATGSGHGKFPRVEPPVMGISHEAPPEIMGNSHDSAPAPYREPARANSDSGPEIREDSPCVCVNSDSEKASSLAQEEKLQDNTHTHNGDCLHLPFPYAESDVAWVDEFCLAKLMNEVIGREVRGKLLGYYPPGWIRRAMKRAKTMNISSFHYIRKILLQWEAAGGPNPGAEDYYDDDMQPIKASKMPDLAPVAAAPVASRFPLSRAAKAEAEYRQAKEMIAAGISPWSGKPFAEECDDE